MKYFKYLILTTLFFCSSIFADTQLSSAVQLTRLLNQFTTLKANFTQKTVDINNQVLQTSNGNVMLQRPGHFRWETLQPSHQIVTTNGNTIWVYDVDLKQATKESLKHIPVNPAKLLSGHVAVLLKQFTIHLIPHQNIMVFQLIPKKPNKEFCSLALAFSHEKLISMQIENSLKETTTFDFSDLELNTSLSPTVFEFSAPAGVDVLS
ncbi:MAG: outer membrane lipoprotein chaperone LolA [Gammaproteobacteria bacterium]|nr:outer membrane lipoprotein chaperone LolA [Gammaproteobacteria bacterium]